MEIIDNDKPDRTQVIWGYTPNSGGTAKFAVWHIGTNFITLFHQEGMWMERQRRNGKLPVMDINIARRMAERWCDVWGPIVDELWSGGQLYK